MKRTYVLDTNVLLSDPNALDKFAEHDIVLPLTVIEEMDNFKHDVSAVGFAAREVSRRLDTLREEGSLNTGVPLEHGGVLRVDFSIGLDSTIKPDNQILQVAKSVSERLTDREVIFVSMDTNMRLKADSIGLLTEGYDSAKVVSSIEEMYTGYTTINVGPDSIRDIYSDNVIPVPDYEEVYLNQMVILKSAKKSALCICTDKGIELLPINKDPIWGILPKNKEQTFAMHLLMDPSISLVTLSGIAGGGKTLLALCAGLALTVDEPCYEKITVARPIMPMGKDIGFLPGTAQEKIDPWMKPVYDNLEILLRKDKRERKSDRNKEPRYQYLIDTGLLDIEVLTYIRGRSIQNQFLIIDEAQNLNKHEIKTIISRAGLGTKIILTGDPEQIDSPYVDRFTNGLTYVTEKFKGQREYGHITLQKGERSRLSELAATLL